MIIPPFLKPGDSVGIVATARWIDHESLGFAVNALTQWGLETVLSDNLFRQNFQLAGTDQERAAAMQSMLNNPEIKAIIIARGGYGTVRLLEHLDWTGFRENPKWICGYSDITVLHGKLSSLGISSVHSTMPVSFPVATDTALETFRNALFGSLGSIQWRDNESQGEIEVRGPVKGGNLSVLYSLCGSPELPDNRGCIVFLEDVDEHFYHIDRMMMGLSRAGFFNGAKAIIVGGMTQMKDNTREFGFPADNPWGSDCFEMTRSIGQKHGIPVVSGFPAGHMNDNRAFYLGADAVLRVSKGNCTLTFNT